MPPRAFQNPAPKTESARSALSAFTCTLCNKTYSRHPEYEAHISSYDHQHRKRLQDLKQLSRDPNAAEKARRAERRADAEAGLKVIDAPAPGGRGKGTGGNASGSGSGSGGAGGRGGGFKKGGFKSSFSTVKGPVAPVRKNVLGDDEEEEDGGGGGGEDRGGKEPVSGAGGGSQGGHAMEAREDVESDTDEEYARDREGGGYYDPRRPTGCHAGCAGLTGVKAAS